MRGRALPAEVAQGHGTGASGVRDVSTSEAAKVSIAEQATQLAEPFTMLDLAQIDELALSIFVCQGRLPFHRHMDQDELFLPYNGTIHLETDWGNLTLREGDAAVVPKGVGHRSSSLQRSLVLLLQPRLMVTRRNGHRRLFAVKKEAVLQKVSLPALGQRQEVNFEALPVLNLDVFALTLTVCQGRGPWWQGDQQSSLVLCYEGQITLESQDNRLSVQKGELVVVPKGHSFRISSPGRSLVLGVQKHPHPELTERQ
jgi:mannose-6-phosphate isomerase-like protein (cupin superfamily)